MSSARSKITDLVASTFRGPVHIDLFEAYSAFTRVTARTLALPPVRGTLTRRLQPFRYLHDCSGCFRLERLPGGPCTHRKAPPFHGAHPELPLPAAIWKAKRGRSNLGLSRQVRGSAASRSNFERALLNARHRPCAFLYWNATSCARVSRWPEVDAVRAARSASLRRRGCKARRGRRAIRRP